MGSTGIEIIDVHNVPRDREERLRSRGLPTPAFVEISPNSAAAFHNAVAHLAEHNPYAASLHVYEVEDYEGMRLFLAPRGEAGFALNGTEIVSLFTYRGSEMQGAARAMLSVAVANGGNNLSCFNTKLPRMYAQEGFIPAARTPWNPRMAPADWDISTYANYQRGLPDVVFSAYQPWALDGSFDDYEVPVVADYQAGMELVGRVLEGHRPAMNTVGLR